MCVCVCAQPNLLTFGELLSYTVHVALETVSFTGGNFGVNWIFHPMGTMGTIQL